MPYNPGRKTSFPASPKATTAPLPHKMVSSPGPANSLLPPFVVPRSFPSPSQTVSLPPPGNW